MRRSPRRPLILKRRKLPFVQNESQSQPSASVSKEATKTDDSQCFPDGIRIMDHPSMSDTQVVVIPKTADLQSVIGALTAKGKESGVQGRNKFILLSEDGCHSGSLSQSGAGGPDNSTENTAAQLVEAKMTHNSQDVKQLTEIKKLNTELECGSLDDSLTDIQCLEKMSTSTFKPDPTKHMINKENQNAHPEAIETHSSQTSAEAVQTTVSERPPYSYMAMIQFAINSRKNRRMTLKEIYMWIEDHFPYFREVAKPGWKNSIRHNLSLHDMFIRETSPDGKVSFWTIRPEANRCLTFDQMYKPGCDPMTAPVPVPMPLFPHEQQKRILPDLRKTPTGSDRRMKPLLPRTDSYLVPIQLPIAPSLYLQSSSAPACSQHSRTVSRGAKRVRIAPKMTQSDAPPVAPYPQMNTNVMAEMKEESTCIPIKHESPISLPRRQASSSRRKQLLINSAHEEPVLLCPENTFLDSGVASDASTFHDVHDTELEDHRHQQQSPDREFSFKTPIKSSSHLASSTPSKHISTAPPETWKVTPVGKGSQNFLDFSPIRTPGGPAVTPRHDYTNFSFSSTPFKDLPLFSSPRELLTSTSSKATGSEDSPIRHMQSTTPSNRSITEGLILDTMNDSLSKILVDISFSGLDDEDLEMANISWSEFIPQFK